MSLGSDEKIAPAQTKRRFAVDLEPEATIPDRDDRLREIAYFLWLDDGCPDGEADRHWSAAEALLELRTSRAQAPRRRASRRTVGRGAAVCQCPSLDAPKRLSWQTVPSSQAFEDAVHESV